MRELRFVDVCAPDGLLPSAITVLGRLGIGGQIRTEEERDTLSWLAGRLQWAIEQERAMRTPDADAGGEG